MSEHVGLIIERNIADEFSLSSISPFFQPRIYLFIYLRCGFCQRYQ